MSELAKRDDRAPAPVDPGAKPNPLKQLPEEWRAPAMFFFTFYAETLKGTAALAARFRLWMKRDGLTLAEARAIMDRLMRPEHAATIEFPGQLHAKIAAGVAEAVAARRAVARAAAVATQAERHEGAALAGYDVRRMLKDRLMGGDDAS